MFILYLFSIFISAGLLFLIQPIIGKVVLPWFGGGSSVWTTCMLFFQVFLLLGYCYAHCLTTYLSLKYQAIVHSIILIFTLAWLPLSVSLIDLTINSQSPQYGILVLLTSAIGLPYFILSSTGPLLQSWFSYTEPTRDPYRLYSLSNLGSLIGLVIYPFGIEPNLVNNTQMISWSFGYFGYVLITLGLAAYLSRKNIVMKRESPQIIGGFHGVLLWVLLSALGVSLLLAVTNSMTQNIASVPFLWLWPLMIYLISLIVSFNRDSWYVRKYWFGLCVISTMLTLLIYFMGAIFEYWLQLLIFSLLLLSGCMICHGELARLKPNSNRLTLYYLAISFGGFVGGILVSVIAPRVFNQYIELPLTIIAILGTFGYLSLLKPRGMLIVYFKLKLVSFSVGLLTLVVSFCYVNQKFHQYDIANGRNFYGQLTVKDITVGNINERRLVDGSTSHGSQSLNPKLSKIATTYYRSDSGIGYTINALANRGPLDIAVIGLGAGTLAAYSREQDALTFFELNPMVQEYAKKYFSYIDDSKALINIILGDGRLSLSRQKTEKYDLLVIDAFASDAIPTHLLTVDAFRLYQARIKLQGVIAVHISNSHLDLAPLVYATANVLAMSARLFDTPASSVGNPRSQWVLISKDEQFFKRDDIQPHISERVLNVNKQLVWTDDFSNLLSVLK